MGSNPTLSATISIGSLRPYIRCLLEASSDVQADVEVVPRNDVDLARRVVGHLHPDGGFSVEQIADLIGDCFYHRDGTSAA